MDGNFEIHPGSSTFVRFAGGTAIPQANPSTGTDNSKQVAAPVARPATCMAMCRELRNGRDKTGTGTGKGDNGGAGGEASS